MKHNKPNCVHLSHGKHAPKSYGMYCTKIIGKSMKIESCDHCNHYTPDIRNFEHWYEVNKEQLKGISKDTAKWIWDSALSVWNRTW